MIEFIKTRFPYPIILLLLLIACNSGQSQRIIPAAERGELYLNQLKNKKIGVITNHSGLVNDMHLIDFLLENKINIVRIFAPEHGFRGDRSDGAKISDETDPLTGIPVFSLYGKNKKPNADLIKDLDLILFDIQDVGTRFYTYISTMSYAMEAAAENNVGFILLDRPNPNAYFIDGPVLDTAYSSFIGLHSVPAVYGMTIGEYANMVKGEAWINKSDDLALTVIPIANYSHDSLYQLPVAPSPNLPNMKSVYLYTSLCYLEASKVSVGRGTKKPFQLIGYPGYPNGDYVYIPISIPGVSKYPKYEGEECNGIDLSKRPNAEIVAEGQINWTYVWEMYAELGEEGFYKSRNSFTKLTGSTLLMKALKSGWTIEEFRRAYEPELLEFKKRRSNYLLYP